MEDNVMDLIKNVLVHNKAKRLGSMEGGAEDIKNHRCNKNINQMFILTSV